MRGSKPGERRGGRQKGTPNKVHRDLKTMMLSSLDRIGGEAYLIKLAETHPASYAMLIAKCIPTQVDAKVEQHTTITVQERRQKALELIEAAFGTVPGIRSNENRVH